MSKGPQRIRGTQDIWGEEADRFQAVVAAFERVRRLYGFGRVEMPVFEATDVFARSIGETTDIVSKEMYSFEDRGGDSLTLRPEFTAGICRAYLSEGWQQHAPFKLATHGPVFRYERPQKGRYRQFHQLDAEIIGSDSPRADVELLTLAASAARSSSGSPKGSTLQLNTLGDAETRSAWRSALVGYFQEHRIRASAKTASHGSTRTRLRILDSKDPRDRPIVDCGSRHRRLSDRRGRRLLQPGDRRARRRRECPGRRNSRLVRGLDYYRHTAFEFVTDRLGAQGAVIAGGRYDGLMESARRPAHAGGRLGGGDRAARHADAGPERRAGRKSCSFPTGTKISKRRFGFWPSFAAATSARTWLSADPRRSATRRPGKGPPCGLSLSLRGTWRASQWFGFEISRRERRRSGTA